MYDTAPKNVLSAAFDTEDEDSIIKEILQKGDFQTVDVSYLPLVHLVPYFRRCGASIALRQQLTFLPTDAQPPGSYQRLQVQHEHQVKTD
jgi:hypothetical protein